MTRTMTLDELRAFITELKETGLREASFNWGITEPTLLRGLGRPVETITGSDTDSELNRYRMPDGNDFWSIDLCGPDDRDGVPYFQHRSVVAPADVIERGQAIEAWLDENRDAYEVFVPIRWSAAPDAARAALGWMNENKGRWKASPLAAMYEDLYAELMRAVGETD